MSKSLYGNLPETPGIYLMKDIRGRVLYIGKAGNLRRRVSSYFLRPHDARIEKLVSAINKIDYEKTDTALEALILEAKRIKEFMPPFNVREKDDKSFLYIEITKERFPRLLLAREKDAVSGTRFGPFTEASSAREALRILKRIFPWSIHEPAQIGTLTKPCFDYEIGLCPGTCTGVIGRADYLKNIKKLKLFFDGKKQKIIRTLQKEMKIASQKLEFEKAEKLRRQIFALEHIRDTSLIKEGDPEIKIRHNLRIEGYDISNISGTGAVGSMVVFGGEVQNKNEYRKFRIRTITGSDDTGMLKEVLRRRFQNNWPLPNVILVDGGAGQVNAAKRVLAEFGLKIPIVGVAKGPKRKRNDFIGIIPRGTNKKTLIKVRDEAHRFAIGYHKRLRSREFLG